MIELKREFYDFLLRWKQTKQNECLLVKGARQIGKTFIIEKFGRENYDHFIEINFIFNPEYLPVFDGNIDAESLFSKISAIRPNVRFVPSRTLLFLDEIQECPNARTALKPLALSAKCDVIASGSLLGIKYKGKKANRNPKSIAVGYEHQVTMHSLSFREYLWASGYDETQIDYLRGFFERREIVPAAVNDKFHSLLREYAVVGGMPAVVCAFMENRHFGDVQRIQEEILSATIDDIHKYSDQASVAKIESCYRAVPRILSLPNRKFKYSEIEKGGSSRKYIECVEWLNAAHLTSKAECVNAVSVGLPAYVREDWYKLYMSDVGLLMAQYGMLAKRQLLDGSIKGTVKGGIYENIVAGILERNGIPLYYHKNEKGDIEMEFIAETDDGVVPLEVKSTNGATLSLDKILASPSIPYGFKFTGGNVGFSGKKITLPHYLALFVRSANDSP